MKGITPVIAVILLLLVTIAMIAFAFVWFGRISTSAMSAVENQTGQFYQTAGKIITIDNILSSPQTIVTVRNIGTLTVLSSELTVYRGTVLASCTPSWSLQSIPPGQSSACTISGPCVPGTTIKVTSPGNFDQTNC